MKGERTNGHNVGWMIAAILLSTSVSAQVIQYNYGAVPAHAPMYDSFYTYSYDRNGNLTQITDRYTSAVKQRLEYNSLNKLLRATAGTSVTEYRYDANGNRVEKIGPAGTEKYYGLIEAKGSTKTYYYFLGSRRVAQRTIGGNVYFHQQDHLGSASVLTDSSGAVQSRTSYHEFGSIKWQEGQGGLSDYTYNDKRWDKETNFYDYGARGYNAKVFKFTTPDSIIPDLTNPQSLNRYAYVQNNPLKYMDPTGHSPKANEYLAAADLYERTPVLGQLSQLAKIEWSPQRTLELANYFSSQLEKKFGGWTIEFVEPGTARARLAADNPASLEWSTKKLLMHKGLEKNASDFFQELGHEVGAIALGEHYGGPDKVPRGLTHLLDDFASGELSPAGIRNFVAAGGGQMDFALAKMAKRLGGGMSDLGKILYGIGKIAPGIGNFIDGLDDARAQMDAPGYAREFRESADSPFLLMRLLSAFDFVSNPWPYLHAEGQVQQNLNMCGKEDCGWGKPL